MDGCYKVATLSFQKRNIFKNKRTTYKCSLIEAIVRSFCRPPAVASSQGGHGGLRKEEVIIFSRVFARVSHQTPQSSEQSHTEKSRESCVELVVLISFAGLYRVLQGLPKK